MPLDAIAELLVEKTMTTRSELKRRFTFEWLGKKIIERQKYGKDTIIIITGTRRGGKSNWGLKEVRAYISLRKKAEEKKGGKFDWSWKGNFPISRTQAIKQAQELVLSFQFYDEGGDQFYTQETMRRAQRELIKYMNKSGINRNLTIIIWPDLFTLDQKVINMADLMVIVPYRYKDICSFAFIYGKSANPLTYDKFGMTRIRKKLESPTKSAFYTQMSTMDGKMKIRHRGKDIEIPYPKNLFKFLRSIPSFKTSHRFGPVDTRFEATYIKNVKERQLQARDQDHYVPIVTYNKLKLQYETLLHNLYVKNDMSYAQLERLHISPADGAHLKSVEGIKRSINTVKAMI